MFLLKDTSQHGDTGEALPAAPRSRVKHSITEPLCTGGWGMILITVILIYRRWVFMAYSEKLSDIIALGICEVYYTKKSNIAFALA